MIIEFQVNNGWETKGKKASVTTVDLFEGKVIFDGVVSVKIGGFLENLHTGRYKVISG